MNRLSTQLQQQLSDWPGHDSIHVAFSGGMDSHLLLHAVGSIRSHLQVPVEALYVDHQLQSQSAEWGEHCRVVCDALGLPFKLLRVEIDRSSGESLEAAAREARYRALRSELGVNGLLLTAHHQDDQAESLMLQLLRGAGPHGLAAMPKIARFGSGWHGRPLLGLTRDQIEAYAVAERLEWIEDDSNRSERFDRNFLRHQIFPQLKARWPSVTATIARSAELCAEAVGHLDGLAETLLQQARPVGPTLSVPALSNMDCPSQRLLLRHWIQSHGMRPPDRKVLQRIPDEVLNAAADRQPLVNWPEGEIRRYRERLYLMSPQEPAPRGIVLSWKPARPLRLPSNLGELEMKPAAVTTGELTVRFRSGGESCRPVGRDHGKSLKQLMQEAGVLPWMRDRVPLVYAGDELVMVAGVARCGSDYWEQYSSGATIHWLSDAIWRAVPPKMDEDSV